MADLVEALRQADEEGEVELDCGCVVEPDASCPCGNESPLVTHGLI
jgi:hypothetical protein